MNNNKTTKVINAIRPAYRQEFASIADSIDTIAAQAVADQQAGISVMKGREQYTDLPSRSHYHNSWIASIKLNGIAK